MRGRGPCAGAERKRRRSGRGVVAAGEGGSRAGRRFDPHESGTVTVRSLLCSVSIKRCVFESGELRWLQLLRLVNMSFACATEAMCALVYPLIFSFTAQLLPRRKGQPSPAHRHCWRYFAGSLFSFHCPTHEVFFDRSNDTTPSHDLSGAGPCPFFTHWQPNFRT